MHRSIYDDYVKRFVDTTRWGRTLNTGIFKLVLLRKLTVGDPNDENNKLGALISKEHLAKVKHLTYN